MEITREIITVDEAWRAFISLPNDYLPSPAAEALFKAGWEAKPSS